RFGRRFPAYFMAVIFRQAALVATSAFIVVPFFLGPVILFVQEALLLEGASLGKAIARSRALARNRVGFGLGLWLATVALPVIGALVVDLVGDSVVGFVLQLGQPFGSLRNGGSGFAVAGALLAVPVAAAARFLGY